MSASSVKTAPASTRPPRRLFIVAALASVVGLLLTLSFGYADHSPRPHDVRLAVAAPKAVVRDLSAGLDRVEPGGFDAITVRSASAAMNAVRSESTAGAFVVPPAGPATIVTAAAAGLNQQQAITAALTGAASVLHRPTRAVDVVPLPAGDSAGLASFVLELGLLIPSIMGSIAIFLLGRRHRVWWRVAAAGLFAVLAGCMSVLALGPILGALTGHSVALIGVAVFGALSFVLTVSALQAVFGLPGTGLGALLIVFFGNAVSGGTVPLAFLPGGFRQLSQWLPNAAIVHAVRSLVYFSGHSLGHSMLVLGLWVGVAVMVLAGVDLLHWRERRRTPERAPQIQATSGLALLRRPRPT